MLHSLVLRLPVITTFVSAVFAVILFAHYRRRGGGLHLFWWGLGMVTYGLGTMTEAYTSLVGWNPVVFKLWYVTGAFLGGYPLAQGTIYLLMNRRFADWSARIASSVIALAALLVFISPLNVAAAEPHRLSGVVLQWQWLRAISPLLNLYALAFLAGGAVLSAIRIRRQPALRDRYAGNILIAIGAVLPAFGGMMTRFGVVEALYITELLGLLTIFAGYRRCSSTPRPAFDVRPLRAAAAAMLAVFIIAPVVHADDQPAPATKIAEAAKPADPMPSFFAETTITATGTERDVFEIATPVTVIRQQQIERKAPQNAADLLREQPGVDVNGIGPNQARPVIRGLRGLRVLFLENGVRMNNARRQTDFGEITGLVDLQSVGTIEVVRGPASVLYGSDAIGGVLNLVSREPHFASGSHFNGFADFRYAGAGKLGSGSAGINAAMGKLTFQLGATTRTSDDYRAPSGRFGNINLPSSTLVRDTSVKDNTIWGSAGYTVNPRDRFVLRFNRYHAGQTGFGYVPGSDYGVVENTVIRILYPTQSFNRIMLSYIGTPLQQVWGDSTNIQVYRQANHRQLANNIEINIGPVAPGFPNSGVHADTLNTTDLTTNGIRADIVKVFGASGSHVVTYGFEGFQDRSENTDSSKITTTIRTPHGNSVIDATSNKANAPNATNTSYGVFVQDEISVTSRLHVTPGLRFHTVSTAAEATPNWDINGLSFKDRNVVGAVTATYQVATYLNLLGSFGSAFRAPNIIERLFNGPTPEGAGYQLLNPNLTSETSRNWDLGLKYRRNDAFMEAVAFRNDIHEGIIQSFLSPTEIAVLPQATRDAIKASGARFVVQQRNADRLRYDGVELALGYHAPMGLTVGGNYTYINGVRVDSINPPTGDSYRTKAFVYARWEPAASRFWAEYHVRHNGATDANLAPNSPVPALGTVLPAFTLHGVGAGMRFLETKQMNQSVTVWVENLSNKLYAEFSNATFFRPETGRTAKVSYRINF